MFTNFPRTTRARPALACALAIGVCAGLACGQDEPFTLDDALGNDVASESETSLLDRLGENLRFNVDFVSRVETTSRRGEAAFVTAIGLDIRKVISNDDGDFGTLALQPYVVRRDNSYDDPLPFDGDDAFLLEAHDFYLNITRWGRGRTNIKVSTLR